MLYKSWLMLYKSWCMLYKTRLMLYKIWLMLYRFIGFLGSKNEEALKEPASLTAERPF